MNDFSSWGYDEVASVMQHSPEWHERRRQGIGSSDAAIIMSGDDRAQNALWRLKRGEIEPDDSAPSLLMQQGIWSEPWNRYLYECATGRQVSDAGSRLQSAAYPFMCANFDGLTTTASGAPAIFEAKQVGGFRRVDGEIKRATMADVIAYYQPQLHHLMAVADREWAVLSVIFEGPRHEIEVVQMDPWYCSQLIDGESAFWECVLSGKPPKPMPPVLPPVPPSEWRTVDMTGNNRWAEHAFTIIETEVAIKRNAEAKAGIKELMAPDVGCGKGHGVTAKRSKPSANAKAGAVTIRIDGNDE